MTEIKIVVVDLRDLRRIVAEAVHDAGVGLSNAKDWVDARSSGLGRSLFLRLAREGAFPVSKRGKTYVARRADVDAYLESQRIQHESSRREQPHSAGPGTSPASAHTDASGDPVARELAAGRLRIVSKI